MPITVLSQFPLDTANYLHDSAAKTATFAGEVSGAAKIIDLGVNKKFLQARLVLDLTALDLTTGDEAYTVQLQYSDNTSFNDAGLVQSRVLFRFGAATASTSAGFDQFFNTVAGRYDAIVESTYAGLQYRYLRLKTVLAGTSPSITFSAFLTHQHRAN